MSTIAYNDIAAYLNKLFAENGKEINWDFDIDNHLLPKNTAFLNVFYSVKAVGQFYKYFGENMKRIEQSEDDELLTTMFVCPAGLYIKWSCLSDMDKNGITVSTSEVAKNIADLISSNQRVIILHVFDEEKWFDKITNEEEKETAIKEKLSKYLS